MTAEALCYRCSYSDQTHRRHAAYLHGKRGLDCALGLLVLLFTLPLAGVIWILMLLTGDRGPLFYSEQRLGYLRLPFTIYKFRTMRTGAVGTPWTGKNDPRVTWLGRYLRKFRVDEFPQCLNVLRGEMSFVGPRPFNLPVAAEMDKLPNSNLRYMVKPGITGFAVLQRTGAVSSKNQREVLQRICTADLTYVQFANFSLDLRILLKSPGVMLSGRGRT